MKPQLITTYNPSFGIYKGHRKTPYGEYTWGEYRGHKIEIYNAIKDRAKLFYVSENFTSREALFKFSFPQNGMKRVIKGSLLA